MQLPQSLSRLTSVARDVRSGRWVESLPMIVSAVLVVALAWQLVQLGWKVYELRKAQPPAVAVTGAFSPSAAAINIRAIVDAHLFGVAGSTGANDPNAVSATQMNLVLVGTIAESDPGKGYAIIGESATSAKVYAAGKTISGGTKLHAVYPDRVILDRGGKLEALMLPRKFQGGGAASPLPQATAVGGWAEPLRQVMEDNPQAITDVLRPQPVFADGHQRGYRVYPGRNRQQFTRLGLMPGDLVTAINGAPLDDPARGMEILQSMNSAAVATVTVERNGQPTQITINNAEFAADVAAAAALPEPVPVTEMTATPGSQDQAE